MSEEKKKRVRPTVAQVKALEDEIAVLSGKYNAAERPNRLLEQEVKRRGDVIERLTDDNIRLRRDNERLVNRSFWDRIWNK